ncbi:helicase-related protein [Aureimonas frigidaquae]|uniref:Transcription-repair-coupling factor n=1 Tax=Aureimonas frigidaquae TaxID=424757 RepID=A0A0P0Z3M8_9HYPH|nr:helicase-related protein [Aureimonas frigidaquae]BAT28531.1 putative transcription-repair coupling factor [Aureimonas frigidaquae]
MLQKLTIETQRNQVEALRPLRPIGAVAAILRRQVLEAKGPMILYVAQNARRAEELSRLLRIFGGHEAAASFPRWDGLDADDMPATSLAAGQRMSVLRWLMNADKRPQLLATTAEALLRRVPARSVWRDMHLEYRVGDAFDPAQACERLEHLGYTFDERVDAPGEAAIRGRVVEIFPAAAPRPCRIETADGVIHSLRAYHPATQRTQEAIEHLIVDPAIEEVGKTPETVFDYLGDCRIIIEDGVDRRADDVLASLAEDENAAARAMTLTHAEWQTHLGPSLAAVVEAAQPDDPDAHVPAFALDAAPLDALCGFVEELRTQGYQFVLTGPSGQAMRLWSRRIARRLGISLDIAHCWKDVEAAGAEAALRFDAPIHAGFVDHAARRVVIALRDVAGQSVGAPSRRDAAFRRADEPLKIGDAVVHFDHGVAMLDGVETMQDGDSETEALRLRYHDDAILLVPFREIGFVWRYGGQDSEVALDRLTGDGWAAKRDRIVLETTRTAEAMLEAVRQRAKRRSDPIRPDPVLFERFCVGFPYELSAGQADAAADVAADLASGRPMDRLLCADVGFGKTEIALRAAAAACLAGRQAAIVAPTTVLARQHFETARKRFQRLGIGVAMLSRLQTPAEARSVKAGLADGTIHLLIATHAICAKDVAFADLALLVIDEEQRFGARHKTAMRNMAAQGHVLSMTATPIPRTLQAGFVGMTELSVIDTPPPRRLPVRTRHMPFDQERLADILAEEAARKGQSFVVCPRIEDLEPMAAALAACAPKLKVTTLHGDMSPAKADRAMLDFAAGKGDVLLATNIVESGLDVPNANTIVVFRPDLFGLSQLHQLRGRVGRGRRRGSLILMTDPGTALTEAARTRIRVLSQLTTLGSGFDISLRDLDLRGAGDLLGSDQAGHLQMIGVSLYRRVLERALAVAKGEEPPQDWRCDMGLSVPTAIPQDYLPEAELRIELAASLDRADTEDGLAALRAEVEDRFGALPAPLQAAFAVAQLRLRAQMLGIRKLDAGPRAVAATFTRHDADRLKRRVKPRKGEPLRWAELRLILDVSSDDPAQRLDNARALLERLS